MIIDTTLGVTAVVRLFLRILYYGIGEEEHHDGDKV